MESLERHSNNSSHRQGGPGSDESFESSLVLVIASGNPLVSGTSISYSLVFTRCMRFPFTRIAYLHIHRRLVEKEKISVFSKSGVDYTRERAILAQEGRRDICLTHGFFVLTSIASRGSRRSRLIFNASSLRSPLASPRALSLLSQ